MSCIMARVAGHLEALPLDPADPVGAEARKVRGGLATWIAPGSVCCRRSGLDVIATVPATTSR
jgi:hypothetical protein